VRASEEFPGEAGDDAGGADSDCDLEHDTPDDPGPKGEVPVQNRPRAAATGCTAGSESDRDGEGVFHTRAAIIRSKESPFPHRADGAAAANGAAEPHSNKPRRRKTRSAWSAA